MDVELEGGVMVGLHSSSGVPEAVEGAGCGGGEGGVGSGGVWGAGGVELGC